MNTIVQLKIEGRFHGGLSADQIGAIKKLVASKEDVTAEEVGLRLGIGHDLPASFRVRDVSFSEEPDEPSKVV